MAHSIYCPNPLCQAANPVERQSCQVCGAEIPHRYLWLPNSRGLTNQQKDYLVNDRYLIIQTQILLDTKPSHVPVFAEEMDDWAIRYAELFRYKTHIPQIYGYLEQHNQLYGLLENNAVYQADARFPNGTTVAGELMPEIASRWLESTIEQQISWMSQLFSLWQHLGILGLIETLLKPELIRVNGENLHVLNLEADQTSNPSLSDFAVLWGELLDWANSPFWSGIATQMIQGQIVNSDQVLNLLDQEMRMIHLSDGSQGFEVDIATLTDQGPSRSENQDACYPDSNSFIQSRSSKRPWLVVCDGIGGHDGGSLASQLAINTIEQYLSRVNLETCLSDDLEMHLEKAVLVANDVICERNDREGREAKQRMGTTVVLAYIRHNQLFLTHVGDSRAYRITDTGCYQITVDDDLASREAIYGSAFYREALQYPGTGALTQALGMSESAQLQPTTQRFWLTESCTFLFCSDGLSDFDLVERLWAAEIRPVLHDRSRLLTTCQRLVAIANEQNGHDNVTVGLLNVIRPTTADPQASTLISQQSTLQEPAISSGRSPSTRVAVVPKRASWLKISFFGLIALGIVGVGGFAWMRSQLNPSVDSSSSLPPPQPSVTATPESKLQVGQLFEVKGGVVDSLALLPQLPGETESTTLAVPPDASPRLLTPGTIVQISRTVTLQNPETQREEEWVNLKICFAPPSETAPATSGVVGAEGWQRMSQVTQQVNVVDPARAKGLDACMVAGAVGFAQ